MEGVFEVSFGPTFTTLRRYRYRLYARLYRPVGLCLEEWETNRVYPRLIAAETDARKIDSLEHEHMWQQQEIDDIARSTSATRCMRRHTACTLVSRRSPARRTIRIGNVARAWRTAGIT